MRPRVFIASGTGVLPAARALHAALEADAEVTVWDQGVFGPSSYIMPTLIERTLTSDFAIMVLGSGAPNENVLIELGLFVGRLGLDRVYLVVPRRAQLDLPSDLAGLTVARYDDDRRDGNLDAGVATVAQSIRQRIGQALPQLQASFRRTADVRYFEEFEADLTKLIETATSLEACFIHSRRWREQHDTAIRSGLSSGRLRRMTLYLPDVRRSSLRSDLDATFEDAPAIPGMVFDAFRWTVALSRLKRNAVRVFLYPSVPGHTFYKFDRAAILALYPASKMKKAVPAVLCRPGSDVWEFLEADIPDLRAESAAVTVAELEALCESFRQTNSFV